MAKKEFDDGKSMESSKSLLLQLKNVFELDDIKTDGGVHTKGDVVGYKNGIALPMSIKFSNQKNTQVHLPTLKSFARSTGMPLDIRDALEKWLGVSNQLQFESWLNGNPATPFEWKYKRLCANRIPEWKNVIDWFNTNNKKIAELLILAMRNQTPAKYLVWVYKKKYVYKVIDTQKLIEWIESDCKWVTGKRDGGTTIRCENMKGKPIFHLQMKGSGGIGDEYNHSPQFHIYTNWPSNSVVHTGTIEPLETTPIESSIFFNFGPSEESNLDVGKN